jgi:NADPH2:quinone reductase
MLVAILANRGVNVIGIASGRRCEAVRAAGAAQVVDRAAEDVAEAVKAHTSGTGVAAVYDPIGAATFETSLRLLAPRGCLINYGELTTPVPDVNLHRLFPGSVFVTKYNGMRWARVDEFAGLIAEGLRLAANRRAVISEVAGRFSLDQVADAYRALESNPQGKVLVLPNN